MCFSVYIIWCIIILWCSKTCYLRSISEGSIFQDYCNVKCQGQTHTMCPSNEEQPQCKSAKPPEIYELKDTKLMETIVNGHNGIRNRVAEKTQIPNMLEMVWDYKLASMAEDFLLRCNYDTADACTLTNVVFSEENTLKEFFKFNHSQAYIVQNMYSEEASFYPFKFIERGIRSWYFEKDGIRTPIKTTIDGNSFVTIEGENNLTHMAYPNIYFFGCGMAKFEGRFYFVCNYYPYYRTVTNTIFLLSGEPGTACPAKFPLADIMYSYLCTNDPSYFAVPRKKRNSAKEVTISNIFYVSMALLLNVTLL